MPTEEDSEKVFVSTSISLKKYQYEWVKSKPSFNLSGFVQERLDELIKNDGAV